MVETTDLKPSRIVLDTNCIVSALLFTHGRLSWLRAGWQRRHFVPLASQDTTAELLRVLKYPKFGLDADERESLLADFLPYAEPIAIVDVGEQDLPTIDDPDDVKFLRLAVDGAASALVTGDSDILALKPVMDTSSILTPAEFFDWLSQKPVG